MNPTKHSEISVHRRGGVIQDYHDIHVFLDHTKTLCADARHRILHNHWAIQYVVIPIFGFSITNADGKVVDVKDMLEEDHLLADYRQRFIPTLSDFVSAIDDNVVDSEFKRRVDEFHKEHSDDKAVSDLMLSPLMVTGNFKSLLITHNSWFINSILPKIFDKEIFIGEFSIAPSDLFNSMAFNLWMDNGSALPPSANNVADTVGHFRDC